MPTHFLLDASALAKRYIPEHGSPNVNHLFSQVAANRLSCLNLGTLEVGSCLVRSHNRGSITFAALSAAVLDFQKEVIANAAFVKIAASDAAIGGAMALVFKHSVNGTDALLLAAALDYAQQILAQGDSLVLVSSDHRLLKAAQAEGLVTFNPETQSQPELDALIAS